ncbi:TPA: hypothetical protein PFD71_003252 [Vibrio cholerae]|nr:hypothetical protein 1992IndM4_0040 [Vibrio phage ICP1]HDG1611362.1 hypothetical protein [Vibrio cholerae]QVV97409.1 hypothetical protein 2017DRC106_0035 [Vibrio phage ICP1]QVV97636.1 hypothetical protein 2017DRC32_0035 [Vibrio phage ICP1]QVV97863.1 hypothetical protein 2017DRC48_0035 [Vibrio phage ICP1]
MQTQNINEYEQHLTQIKIRVNDNTLLQKWVNHLDNLSVADRELVCVTFVTVGNSVILEFDSLYYAIVYYDSNRNFLKNEPIISLGIDADVEMMTDWDRESLEMKKVVRF